MTSELEKEIKIEISLTEKEFNNLMYLLFILPLCIWSKLPIN